MQPFLKTKTYHIPPKMEDLFFFLNESIRCIFILQSDESNDPTLMENVQKVCAGLALIPEVDTRIVAVPDGHIFNWKAHHRIEHALLMIFFGPQLSGIPDLPVNQTVQLGNCHIFSTHSMTHLQNDIPAKQQFWIALKTKVNEAKTAAGH